MPETRKRMPGYGEEKVQTPNIILMMAVKAVAGKNQQVGGSNPFAGSSLLIASLLIGLKTH